MKNSDSPHYPIGGAAFSDLIDSMPGSIFWKDLEGRYLGCNEHLIREAGFASKNDLLGKTDYDLYDKMYADILRQNDNMVLAAGCALNFEESVILPTGRLHVFSVQKMPIRDSNASIYAILGIALEITARHQLFESIIDCMPGSVFWKDLNGKYLGCNKYLLKVAGLQSKEQIVGKTDFELWPDQADALLANDKKVIETGAVLNTEEHVLLPNGQYAIFAAQKMPIFDSNGAVSSIMGVSLDITESKRQQAALVLSEEKLKATQIQAEQFKAMASLSGMLAHELRTPLISVQSSAASVKSDMVELLKGYAYYMEHCPDLAVLSASRIERLQRALDYMERSLRYAATTIRTVLTGLHTVVSDDIEMVSFDVRAAVREAIDGYPMSDDEQALIHVKAADDVALIGVGDVQMLAHVLHNLLKNGLQAIKEAGKGEITIGLQKEADKIIIYFEDTALGMTAEHVAKIFDAFYTTKKQSALSIGLGLYFCKLAMEKMGGHISCVAELGRYTCFEICMKAL